jgi:hypothetical protein
VCLDLVRRLRPDWVALPVSEAARQCSERPERVARLATRVRPDLEALVATMTRRGRPPAAPQVEPAVTNAAITTALLALATDLLAHLRWRGSALRALVVGAYLRLQEQHPALTQQRFCATLNLASRTLRHWLSHPPDAAPLPADPVAPPPLPKTPRPRPLRRPHFGLQEVLPGTQFAADTTDLSCCGVPLKLMATQDVGDRHQHLLDAIIVAPHESAATIAALATESLADLPGAQLLTDQGTPYLARVLRETLEALEVEHAPQREANPQAKSTLERAFGSLKGIAAPLFAATDRLAEHWVSLRRHDLATTVATLVLTALLKAYQAGARAADREQAARQGLPIEALTQAAREHREQARAEDRSKVLLLQHVHDAYAITRPLVRFRRALRRFPLEVLQRAEQAFRTQVHRDDIRDRASYFIAIVQRFHEEYLREQARQQAAEAARQQGRRDQQQHLAQQAARQAHPDIWLQEALESLAHQWRPASHELLYEGRGLGRSWLHGAIAALLARHGPQPTRDLAEGVFTAFRVAVEPRVGAEALAAVRALFDEALPLAPPTPVQSTCAATFLGAILPRSGPIPRSAPAAPLLTYAAMPGGS